MKNNNLLFITYDFPPKSRWGVAKHVSLLEKEMNKFFSTMVATRYENGSISTINSDRITDNNLLKSKFLPFESYVDFEYLMSWNYLFGKKIISEYESEGNFPSIIHNHTWMTFPSALMIKEHFNSKLISSLHFLEKQYDGLKETPTEIDLEDILSIENLIMEKSDAIIVFGENHKNFVLKNYNANEKKIQIINHGIDLDQHQKYVSSPQVYIDKIRINFVGRLVPEKGVMELVQAINELKDNYPYIELNLIGDGYLKEKIVENENIVLHGFLLPQQILEMNKKANIFCFPSYTETFGYAVLEAMASGLPIITTKGERVERLLNPDEALFVNVNYCKKVSMDYGLFKNHIEQLILSSDMRQHFSQKSLVASKRYSKLNMINKTKALYESIDKN